MVKTPVTFDSYRGFKGYVINVDRARWRYDEAFSKLAAEGFTGTERVAAVDFEKIDVKDEIRRMGVTRLERFNNDSEIAVVLSHFKAMHTFLSTSDEYCLIFEDDVTPIEGFRELADFKDINYGEFELLGFGGGYLSPIWNGHDDSNLTLLRLSQRTKASHVNDCCFWQMHAYMLSRKAAYTLTREYSSWVNLGFGPQIDGYLTGTRSIRNKLLNNQNIPNIEKYMHGKFSADRLCGIMFQEGSYVSTRESTSI